MPTTGQVARRLGISGDRRRAIEKLAEETVSAYYQRENKATTAKKSKAAWLVALPTLGKNDVFLHFLTVIRKA